MKKILLVAIIAVCGLGDIATDFIMGGKTYQAYNTQEAEKCMQENSCAEKKGDEAKKCEEECIKEASVK